jgi:hypothetical protein
MADGQLMSETTPPTGESQQYRLQDQAVVNTLEAVVHEIRNLLISVGGFARLAKHLQCSGQEDKYAQVTTPYPRRPLGHNFPWPRPAALWRPTAAGS